MAESEKQVIKAMADAIADLPEGKKQYFIGFAEGVAAMAQAANNPAEQNQPAS